MKRFKLLLKYLLGSALLLLIFVFFFWNTSALIGEELNQGGKAYYDYAPDGQYMAMQVYFNDGDSIQLVLNKEGNVIYAVKVWEEMDISRRGALWLGHSYTSTDYDRVSMSYMTEIPLPVPFYERWYARLFMTVRNVNLDNLEMIPD